MEIATSGLLWGRPGIAFRTVFARFSKMLEILKIQTFKIDKMHAEHLQECCSYRGESPYRMQQARQGLVRLSSGKIPSKMSMSDTHPIEIYINWD